METKKIYWRYYRKVNGKVSYQTPDGPACYYATREDAHNMLITLAQVVVDTNEHITADDFTYRDDMSFGFIDHETNQHIEIGYESAQS